MLDLQGFGLDSLKGKRGNIASLPKDATIALQRSLQFLGYSVGSIDGIPGNDTQYAWKSFKKSRHQSRPDEIGEGSFRLLLSAVQVKLTSSNPAAPPVSPGTINWNDSSCLIGRYFTVRDATKGDRRRFPADDSVKKAIIQLAGELDKLRDAWGNPIGVTSWYRPLAVNRSVGGVDGSQHIRGSAADIYPIGGDIYKFQAWLDKRWDMALGYGAKKHFVHLDLRPGRIRWNY